MERSLIIGGDADSRRFLDDFLGGGDSVAARTSGSTGAPKEIRLGKQEMLASAHATNAFFGIGRGDLLLCPLSCRYIAGKMMAVRALAAGARCLMLPPSSSPLEAWDADGEAALLPIVPSQTEGLLADTAKLPLLRNVLVGGAPLSAAREKALAAAPFRTWVSFGMTETCSHVALRPAGDDVYRALEGYSFSADGRGCLVVDRRFDGRRFTTNDVVEILDDAAFRWMGRADNVVNSGGVKLFPEMLERCLDAEYAPDTFYFTSRRSERWGEEIVAVLTDAAIDADAFLDACRRLLPTPYAVPKAVVRAEASLTADSGKLRRRRL